MENLNMNDLLGKSMKDLVQLRNNLRKDALELRIKNSMRSLKETHKIKIVKRNIARVNTALSYKSKDQNGNNLR